MPEVRPEMERERFPTPRVPAKLKLWSQFEGISPASSSPQKKETLASSPPVELRVAEMIAELDVTKEEEELLTTGKPMVEKEEMGVMSIPFGLLTR